MHFFSCAPALALLLLASSVLAQDTSAPDLAQTCQHIPLWQVCQGYTASDNLECATIKVRRDWTPAKNDFSEVYMRLIRYKARNNPDTAKSIIVNPGGPGESGIQFVAKGGGSLAEIAGYNYHIVGFDPRGVGQNMPYNCNAKLSFASADTVYQSYADGYKNYAQQCFNQVGDLGSIINTLQDAKDVIAISDTVNSDKLVRYWGFSYGTLLGNVIARLAPGRVERMILDGNIDPNSWYYTNTVTKATDTDRAIRQFFSLCASAGEANCAWKASAGQDFTYENLLNKWNNWVGAQPGATNRGRTDANNLNDNQSFWVRYNMFRGIYSANSFPQIASVLQAWYNNKNTIATSLINFQTYTPSGVDAPFTLNSTRIRRRQTGVDPNFNPNANFAMEGAIYGVSCVDSQFHPGSTGANYESLFAAYDQKTAYAGDVFRGGDATCIPWLFKPGEAWPDNWAASGQIQTKNPILFVQTTFDPVTPLTYGQAAKSYYAGAVLVSTNGEGHCSSSHTSQTLNVALRQYWNAGTMPQDGAVYGVVNPNPFTGPASTRNFADGQGSTITQPDNNNQGSSSTDPSPPSGIQPDDASLGADFLALRGADMSHLFQGLHVPKKRSLSVDRLFDGVRPVKRDVATDVEYEVCTEGPETSTSTSWTTTTTSISKPAGATDTYSSWATWLKWTTTTTVSGASSWTTWDPKPKTWTTWDPKPTSWGTWAPKTDGWEAWTSQDDSVPVTKTVSGKVTIVAIPTVTVYIDYVQDVCETGITTKTITVTATCDGGCETKPTGCPPGYTTTDVYCSACATPSTVVVTVEDASWTPVPDTPVKGSTWSNVPVVPVTPVNEASTWSAVPVVPVTPVKSAAWSPVTSVPVKPATTDAWSPVAKYTGAASTVSAACSSFVIAIVAALWVL